MSGAASEPGLSDNGELSKGIFKQRSSTGSEAYSNKFVSLSSVCTLIETIFHKI